MAYPTDVSQLNPAPDAPDPVGGDAQATVHPRDHRILYTLAIDLLAELGTNPSGVEADLTARLAALDTLVAAKETPAGAQAKVDAAVATLIGTAPSLLDTLGEIADALNDDESFAATITTALATKQGLDSELTAIAGLVSAADTAPYFTGSGAASLFVLSAFGRALVDDADATAGRATLGLGTAATTSSGDYATAGHSHSALSINAQTGTTYTLVLGDAGLIVALNNASPVTVTVPPNSSVAFPVGSTVFLRQIGAGQVTVAPGSGVTLRSRGAALKLVDQWSEASLSKRATDEWVLTGDVTP